MPFQRHFNADSTAISLVFSSAGSFNVRFCAARFQACEHIPPVMKRLCLALRDVASTGGLPVTTDAAKSRKKPRRSRDGEPVPTEAVRLSGLTVRVSVSQGRCSLVLHVDCGRQPAVVAWSEALVTLRLKVMPSFCMRQTLSTVRASRRERS